jgi:hypothetical protein
MDFFLYRNKKFLNFLNSLKTLENRWVNYSYSGVQGISNVFHIVNKVENKLENTYILDLIDNVEYVVHALYYSNWV